MIAMTPRNGQPVADPWDDSQPKCRVHSDAPAFRTLLEEATRGRVTLLADDEPAEREVVLVDCRHATDSLALARQRFPARPVVGIVPRFDPSSMVELIASGADGVLALDDPADSWREALNVVLGGGRWLGGPGLEISLEQKHARYDVAKGSHHSGDVTMRTKLFVKGRVGDKFAS
jgi:DNA-binding NarL/FixJ family response regulator